MRERSGRSVTTGFSLATVVSSCSKRNRSKSYRHAISEKLGDNDRRRR